MKACGYDLLPTLLLYVAKGWDVTNMQVLSKYGALTLFPFLIQTIIVSEP